MGRNAGLGILRSLLQVSARVMILAVLSSLLLWLPKGALAHEVTPTIADFDVTGSEITLTLALNVEAFVAGIDLDERVDTDTSDQAPDYELLRSMSGDELDPMVHLFVEDWLQSLRLEANGDVFLRLTEVHIPEIGDPTLPRLSTLRLEGVLNSGATVLRLHWPLRSGAVVLRQNGVEDPYTGYILGGGVSPAIPLLGGAVQTPFEVFTDYVPVGFDHILPKGLDHILFVLGLYFLSVRMRPLLWQITCFTLAHSITLALGAFGLVEIDSAIVEPLIAASIVFVAVENIFARRLHSWRMALIFSFGLLHGLGFATVLGEFGLPTNQMVPALLGFNVGVEIGQLAVIALAYGTLGYWFGKHPKYRGRVAIPASLTIALIGAYWLVERLPF